jgi:HlyD family secretion protein
VTRSGRIGLATALVAVAAFAALAVSGGGGSTWLRAERRELVLGIPTEGELRAVDSVLIGPPQVEGIWNFQISMMAPEGAQVEAGEPVLGFDTTELRQKLQQATAQADSAEKELEKATTDLDVERRQLALRLEEAAARLRRAELEAGVSEDVVAAAELEQARIDKRLAEIEIANLQASLEQHAIKQRLDLASLRSKLAFARSEVERLTSSIERMNVTAPRAGTVSYRIDWRHNKKSVGDQVWRAEQVLEIPDLSVMEAVATVDEAAAGRLEPGLGVTFRLDAYPDREYRAQVMQIRRAVQRKSQDNPAKVVKVRLELEQTDTERMRPGMRFRGTIVTESSPDTLTIPADAVFYGPEGAFVFVRTAFGRQRAQPELGRHNPDWVEVLGGLEAGDRVLRREAEDGT